MLTWFRDILIAKVSNYAPGPLVNVDRRDSIISEARRMSRGDIDGIISGIISTGAFLAENANPKLAMSVLGLRIT